MRDQVIIGDAMAHLFRVSSESVQTCVTSPPFFGLRDYGVDGQLGQEDTPEEYVEALVKAFDQVKRILTPDGTLWLNLGDSYTPDHAQKRSDAGTNWGKHKPIGGSRSRDRRGPQGDRKAKDLIGVPWMVAFALRKAGWYLRSEIIWSKANPVPEGVKDRPTRGHETVFLLSKSKTYYYDWEAILEDAEVEGETRNRRTVWTIRTKTYPEAHFAVFPEELPERCIRAGSRPGDLVMDPFCGSGTTLAVAAELGRDYLGIELNPDYEHLIRERLRPAVEYRSQRANFEMAMELG